MDNEIGKFQSAIENERALMDAWLEKEYLSIQDQRYSGEIDCAYPHWPSIESLVGEVFDKNMVVWLNSASIDSLLFFISRNEEVGSLLAWLSPKTGALISNSGDLNYPDFLFLAESAVLRAEDFCDYQFVSCFRKFKSIGDREILLLNNFINRTYSYTRRMVLQVFEHFKLPGTLALAKELWQTDDCEFAKLSCLYAIREIPGASDLYGLWVEDYQNKFDIEAEEYRQVHMRRLL